MGLAAVARAAVDGVEAATAVAERGVADSAEGTAAEEMEAGHLVEEVRALRRRVSRSRVWLRS